MKAQAILIGTSVYTADRESFHDLVAVENDLTWFRECLTSSETGLFEDVATFHNAPKDAVHRGLEKAVRAVQKDDIFLFYYSGHGRLDLAGELHLTFPETENEFLLSTGLSSSNLQQIFSRCRADRIVVILDCCYSGAAEGSIFKGDPDASLVHLAGQGEGRYVLVSSGSRQVSHTVTDQLALNGSSADSKHFSAFTYALLDGIATEKADLDEDGFVNVEEWFSYSTGKLKDIPGEQRPRITKIGGSGRSFYIARTAAGLKDLKRAKEAATLYLMKSGNEATLRSLLIEALNASAVDPKRSVKCPQIGISSVDLVRQATLNSSSTSANEVWNFASPYPASFIQAMQPEGSLIASLDRAKHFLRGAVELNYLRREHPCEVNLVYGRREIYDAAANEMRTALETKWSLDVRAFAELPMTKIVIMSYDRAISYLERYTPRRFAFTLTHDEFWDAFGLPIEHHAKLRHHRGTGD